MSMDSATHTAPENGLGTSSFVLGIIGLAVSFIPIVGWFVGLPVAFTGLGVGLGNLPRLRKGKADNKSMTWIGIGLSVGAIVVSIAYIVLVAVGVTSNG